MIKLKSIYKYELFIFIVSFVLLFIENDIAKYVFTIASLGMILLATLIDYGPKKDNNHLRVQASRIVLAILLFYFIVIFLLGIQLGFQRTFASLNIDKWFLGLIPTALYTVVIEYLRYTICKNNYYDKASIIIMTLLFCLINILLNTGTFVGSFDVFKYTCMTILPIIAQEFLATYLVYKYGFLPAIVYKSIMNLYMYVLPIMTDMGDYLYSIFNLLIPYTILMVIRKHLKEENDNRVIKRNVGIVNRYFVTAPFAIAMIIIIILVSGVAKYQVIAIGSDSMQPAFGYGDAILLKKVNSQEIKNNEIIVFYRDGRIISHRVVKVSREPGTTYFYTKGDSNKDPDTDRVADRDVIGVVRKTLKFVGYPTVLLNEIMKEG